MTNSLSRKRFLYQIAPDSAKYMFTYAHEKLTQLFDQILDTTLPDSAREWLGVEKAKIMAGDERVFGAAFVMAPRKTGKHRLLISEDQEQEVNRIRVGLSITNWTADQLARTSLLMALNTADPDRYVQRVEDLFLNAEMNELVALYSALPLFAYPQRWEGRCAEGIRSNIARVLEAVMCRNPYPSEYLSEPAWNQLVLKAIFTDKPLLEIVGLRDRANRQLADSISAFAHERWAAHRSVNPLVWINTERFVNDELLNDLKKLAVSDDIRERKAAVLVCRASKHPGAKALLHSGELAALDADAALSWESLLTDG